MALDRTAFFAAVRSDPFGGSLSQQQVDGMSDLLDVWDRSGFTDPRWLAYILGGVFHEVGGRMSPVREGFAKTDAGARAAVAGLFKAGKISRNYAAPVNGVSYYGRGRIQNTHLANYEKLEKRFGHPFVSNPDLLLDSKIDAEVTIYGHVEGIWTGKKLADYFSGPPSDLADWINARRIVNGTDRASAIAKIAKAFYAALLAAERSGSTPIRDPGPPVPAAPPVLLPDLPRVTEEPAPAVVEADPSSSVSALKLVGAVGGLIALLGAVALGLKNLLGG